MSLFISSLGCGHSGSNEIITRRAKIWMQWKWMRRQWWRRTEVNTWTEFIYCDRFGRIGCHRQPANVDVYFACGTATHRLYSDACPRPTNAVFTEKRRQTFLPVLFIFFISSFRSVPTSFVSDDLFTLSFVHTHTHTRVTHTQPSLRSCDVCAAHIIHICTTERNDEYALRVPKNQRANYFSGFFVCRNSSTHSIPYVLGLIRFFRLFENVVSSFHCALQAFNRLCHPSSDRMVRPFTIDRTN